MGTIQHYFESQGKTVPPYVNAFYTLTFESASDDFFDATVSGASAKYGQRAIANLCAGVAEAVKKPAMALRNPIVALMAGTTDSHPRVGAMFYFNKEALAALLKSIKQNLTQTCEWVSKGGNDPDCHVFTNGVLADLPLILDTGNMERYTNFNESGSPFMEISKDGVTFTLDRLEVGGND